MATKSPLALFEPLSQIEGVTLISLQKGFGAEQVRALGDRLPAHEVGDPSAPGPPTIEDAAAIMMSLDLVISPDTMLAHLAGVLGRPPGSRSRSCPIGAGSSIARTHPGIRRPGSFASRRRVIGLMSSLGSLGRSESAWRSESVARIHSRIAQDGLGRDDG
jgi:hypothetical protein